MSMIRYGKVRLDIIWQGRKEGREGGREEERKDKRKEGKKDKRKEGRKARREKGRKEGKKKKKEKKRERKERKKNGRGKKVKMSHSNAFNKPIGKESDRNPQPIFRAHGRDSRPVTIAC